MAKYKWYKHKRKRFTYSDFRPRGISTSGIVFDEAAWVNIPADQATARHTRERHHQPIHVMGDYTPRDMAPGLEYPSQQLIIESVQRELSDRLQNFVGNFDEVGAEATQQYTEMCLDGFRDRGLVSNYGDVTATVVDNTINVDLNLVLPRSLETIQMRTILSG